jgi:hypothetical protein
METMAPRKPFIQPDFSRVNALRTAIANIERGGARLSENETALIDGIAQGVTETLHQKLTPIERRLAKVEAALGVSRDEK